MVPDKREGTWARLKYIFVYLITLIFFLKEQYYKLSRVLHVEIQTFNQCTGTIQHFSISLIQQK